jgi:hypothetical protein
MSAAAERPAEVFYHGTSKGRAKTLVRTQRPDLSLFGTGADVRFLKGKVKGVLGVFGGPVGFFGKGFYLTTSPKLAAIYAGLAPRGGGVVEVHVDPARLVRASTMSFEDVVGLYKRQIVAGRAERGLPAHTPQRLDELARGELESDERHQIGLRVELARERGYGGVIFSDEEIVIFDPSVVRLIRPTDVAPQ